MTEIDPQPLSSADWSQVEATLGFLWLLWLSVVSMALLLLVAHAIIPSLSATGHIRPQIARARPVVYAAAAAAAAVALFAFIGFVSASEVLRTIYTKVWI